MSHLQKLADAKTAIDKVFADTSTSKEVTRESLEELKEHIEELLETLDDQ